MSESKNLTRPIEVSIIAILHFIAAIVTLVSLFSAIIQASLQWQTLFTPDNLFGLILTIASIILSAVLAWGLWRLQPLARTTILVLQGGLVILLLLSMVSNSRIVDDSTLISLAWTTMTIIGLNTPRARRSFGIVGHVGLGPKLMMFVIPLVLILFWVERSKVVLPQINIPRDVKAITFNSARSVRVEYGITSGPPTLEVLTMNTDGSDVGYVKGTAYISQGIGTWSPDGRAFVVNSYNRDTQHFCLILFDSSGQRCLVREGYMPSWSPDGQYVAFTTHDDYSGRPENIRPATANMINVASGEVTQLVTLPPPSNAVSHTTISQIAWSPDGKTIAYSTQTYAISGTDIIENTGSIWKLDLVNKQPVFLTTGQSPSWSPTHNELAFERDHDIWLHDLETATETVLVHDPKKAYAPAWSPDGRQLLFASMRDGNSEIYRINRDGTELVNLTNNDAYDSAPAWHPTPE